MISVSTFAPRISRSTINMKQPFSLPAAIRVQDEMHFVSTLLLSPTLVAHTTTLPVLLLLYL